MIVKIADFGLAKMVSAGTMLVSLVGTPQYLAPEVVMQTQAKPGYENKVDCWAVGIIVYSMLTKALPFDEDPEMAVDVSVCRAELTTATHTSALYATF
jgi:serine/threonine protein kinase